MILILGQQFLNKFIRLRTMKPESKFWQIIKKNTPKIQWTRLESWSSFGTPDLL